MPVIEIGREKSSIQFLEVIIDKAQILIDPIFFSILGNNLVKYRISILDSIRMYSVEPMFQTEKPLKPDEELNDGTFPTVPT